MDYGEAYIDIWLHVKNDAFFDLMGLAQIYPLTYLTPLSIERSQQSWEDFFCFF